LLLIHKINNSKSENGKEIRNWTLSGLSATFLSIEGKAEMGLYLFDLTLSLSASEREQK